MRKNKDTVFYNHGKAPIYISHTMLPDPFGGPGKMECKVLIIHGDGIDVEVLGLKRGKPKRSPQRTAGGRRMTKLGEVTAERDLYKAALEAILAHEMSQAHDDGSMRWSGSHAARMLAFIGSGFAKETPIDTDGGE